MKVYIVKDIFDNDGFDIIGVFSSRELATKALQNCVTRISDYYHMELNETKDLAIGYARSVYITEYELDGE